MMRNFVLAGQLCEVEIVPWPVEFGKYRPRVLGYCFWPGR